MGENVQVTGLAMAFTGTSFNKSFNIKTGEWLGNYCFKRLRFLNNIHLSQTIAMLFVAIWHGIASGYFVSFGIQGLNLTFERLFFAQMEKSLLVQKLLHKDNTFKDSVLVKISYQIFRWGHKFLYTPIVLLGMHTFTFDRYWPIMRSMGAHWILMSYIILPVTLHILEKAYQAQCLPETKIRNGGMKNGVAPVPQQNGHATKND